MASRHKAREYAVQLLYLLDIRNPQQPEPLIETFWSGESVQPKDRAFAEELVKGTREHLRHIDGIIRTHASNWKISRMPVVDRNILRLGVFELCIEPNLPASVVINEAIELAKHFSGPEAPGFINGVLDRIKVACREDTGDAG